MSDNPQTNVTLWQRFTRLGRHRSSSASVEGGTGTPTDANPPPPWTFWDETKLWLKLKIITRFRITHPQQTREVPQLSPFTSSAFLVLPTPLPVEDVFFGEWWLSALRVVVRSLIFCFTLAGILEIYIRIFVYLIAIFVDLLGLVFQIPISLEKRVLGHFYLGLQKFWEHCVARFLLRTETRGLHRLWWFIYLLTSDMNDFRQNYVEAWRQQHEQSIRISVSDEFLMMPIPEASDDEVMLKRLRMFYRMMRVGQGIPGLLLPKNLERIDCVEISVDTLGRRIETLQLGRYKGKLTSQFCRPELGKGSHQIARKIQGLSRETALEFKQTYNLDIISLVITVPPLASVIFAVVWIRHFVYKEGVDLQVLVATAFTIASYIVTTGALIIAFIAFLDQKRTQNDEMIDRFSSVGSLDQNRARDDEMLDGFNRVGSLDQRPAQNNTAHGEASRLSTVYAMDGDAPPDLRRRSI